MRGRSPFNKPPVRKTDVYRFLIKLGGEGRWKDLKAHLKEFGWGPTTLKRTLDEMIEEGSIYKEARLGRAGPEAWYITKVKDTDIWDAIKREYVPFEQLVLGIQNTLQELEGKQEEKEVFLKRQLQKLVRMPMDAYAALVFMVTGGVKNGKITKPIVAWVTGTAAKILPKGLQFGHAGAMADSFAKGNAPCPNCGYKVGSKETIKRPFLQPR